MTVEPAENTLPAQQPGHWAHLETRRAEVRKHEGRKVDERPPIARRMQTVSWATFLAGAGLISLLGNGAENEDAWYGLMAGSSMALYVLGGLTYRYKFGSTIAVFAAVALVASALAVLNVNVEEELLWPILMMTGGGVLAAKAIAAKYD